MRQSVVAAAVLSLPLTLVLLLAGFSAVGRPDDAHEQDRRDRRGRNCEGLVDHGLVVMTGPANPRASMITPTAADLPMLQLRLTAGSKKDVRVISITLTASGTGNDQSGVSSVRLVKDVNGNGAYDAGVDIQIGLSQTYRTDNGTVTFSNLDQLICASGTVDWLVLYNLSGTATRGQTFTVALASAHDIVATGGTTVQLAGGQKTIAQPEVNTWIEKIAQGAPGSPPARTMHPMVWDGTRVILFGGDAGPLANDLWWYDPGTNTWTLKIPNGAAGSPPGTGPRSMVWDGTKVILFASTSTATNSLWWYDPSTNTWTEKIPGGAPGSPSRRDTSSMVWDGTRVVLFGGYTGSAWVNDTWWYDPCTNTWTEKIPQGAAGSPAGRSDHSMVWTGTTAILFGGDVGGGARLNDLWWYDPATNSWTEKLPQNLSVTDRPSGTVNSPLVWDGSKVIQFGGGNFGPFLATNDTWWYDSGTNKWTQKIPQGAPGSPAVRNGHSMVWDGTRVILFGGYTGATRLNELWWYVP